MLPSLDPSMMLRSEPPMPPSLNKTERLRPPPPSRGTLHLDQRVIPSGWLPSNGGPFHPGGHNLRNMHPFSFCLTSFGACNPIILRPFIGPSSPPWCSRVKNPSPSDLHISANQKKEYCPYGGVDMPQIFPGSHILCHT